MSTFEHRYLTALLVTRSWVILSISILSWTLTLVVVGPQWARLSLFEQGCIALAGTLIALAVVFARKWWTLWLVVAAMAAMGATALVPSGSLVWTYPATYFGYVGFAMIMLLPRGLGLITAITVPVTIWAIWLTGPDNVVPEAFSVGNGTLIFFRMIGAQLMLWWAWQELLNRAARQDDQWHQLRATELAAIEIQDRSALWRDQATRVHATLLNSINALLENRTVNPESLRLLASQGRSAISRPPHVREMAQPRTEFVESENAGLVLLTSALAGMLISGSAYSWFVPYQSGLLAALTIGLSTVTSLVALVVVVRRRRIPWPLGIVTVLLAAAIPWLLSDWTGACSSIGAITGAASMAGFVIVCIGLWSGIGPFLVGLAAWAVGAIQIAQNSDPACQFGSTVIVLNVATFLPLAAVLTLVGARFNKRSREEMESRAAAAHLQSSRAQALTEIDEGLISVARDSARALEDVAAEGTLTQEMATKLACVGAQMRAGVQVDVGSVEGLTRAAYTIIWRLAETGVPVEVGVLGQGGDPRRVPEALIDLLVLASGDSPDARIRIQSLVGDGWDFLSMTVPAEGAQRAGLRSGESQSWEDITLVVSDPEVADAGSLIITLERNHGQAH